MAPPNFAQAEVDRPKKSYSRSRSSETESGKQQPAQSSGIQAAGNMAVQSARSDADRPVLGRTRRSDIASRGAPTKDWYAQFEPQKAPTPPPKVSSIKQAQAWVDDLSGFELEEKRRFKIGTLLKSMVEHLPEEVYLPSNDVISRSNTKDSSMTVTGTIGPIDTSNLRNKLYTAYLAAENPKKLRQDPMDPTGLVWDFDIEQTEPKPFELVGGPFTVRERSVLEFQFPDEMLEWRRRDVEVQESVDREHDRRIGEFMAALGEGSIRAIGQFFEYSAKLGVGGALAAPVAGTIGRVGFGVGPEGLSGASFYTKFFVGSATGGVIGGGTEAVDSAISNFPDLVTGDMSIGDYLENIASSTWSGVKGGTVFGAAGEVAGPILTKFFKFIKPGSKPIAPEVGGDVSATPGTMSLSPLSETPLVSPQGVSAGSQQSVSWRVLGETAEGDVTAIGVSMDTGEIAIMNVNKFTGNGSVFSPKRGRVDLVRGEMVPESPALGAGETSLPEGAAPEVPGLSGGQGAPKQLGGGASNRMLTEPQYEDIGGALQQHMIDEFGADVAEGVVWTAGPDGTMFAKPPLSNVPVYFPQGALPPGQFFAGKPRVPFLAGPLKQEFTPFDVLPGQRPTQRSLSQVRSARGGNKVRGNVGEEFVSQSSGGRREVTTDLPGGKTGRVDNQRPVTTGIVNEEVKNYLRYVKKGLLTVANEVPASAFLRTEITRDAMIMHYFPDQQPVWLFLDAPPSASLITELDAAGIPWLVQSDRVQFKQ